MNEALDGDEPKVELVSLLVAHARAHFLSSSSSSSSSSLAEHAAAPESSHAPPLRWGSDDENALPSMEITPPEVATGAFPYNP